MLTGHATNKIEMLQNISFDTINILLIKEIHKIYKYKSWCWI